MAHLITAAAMSRHVGDGVLLDGSAPGALGGLSIRTGRLEPRRLDVESAAVQLTGSGSWWGADQAAPMRPGDCVYLPPGCPFGWAPMNADASVLLVSATATGAEPAAGRTARRVAGADALSTVDGSVDMGVRWLVTTETVSARRLVVATSTFTAGGSHDLHRHPHADEFFLLVEGRGRHLTGTGEVRMGTGDLMVIPAREWHGFRTDPGVTTRTIYGYLGAGSLEQAGHELRERQVTG